MKIIKKLISVIFFVIILFTLTLSVYSDNVIQVVLDGTTLSFDVEPIIISDRTMVPARVIFEKLGATVVWDSETNTAIATNDDTTVNITINSPVMYVNGVSVSLDAPAVIKNSRTLIPLRAVSEAFDCTVSWDGENRIASIVSKTEDDRQTVLDQGKCGETLYWELLSDGTLHIFGSGAMYDYYKYTEPAPWYKYREEPYISEDDSMILNADGTSYLSTTSYYASNPNNYKIKKIVIDDGITYIGDWAFYRICVEELTIPEGVEETGIFCIRYSPNLKTVNLPDSLKILDDFGISRNYALETINFGSGLEKIGTAGLQSNTSLKSVDFPDSLTQINIQLSPSYTGAIIDYNCVGLMENCVSLQYVNLGSVECIPQRTLLGAAIEEIVIPNTVKSIDEYAFHRCTSLKTITFEEGSICTSIHPTAVQSCKSLESVKGGESLESLGYYATITSLSEFDFSDTNASLVQNQFNSTSIRVARVGGQIISIPKAWMAYNSSLETLYIGNSVFEILDSAFAKCTSLKDIYYDGTIDEWNDISKGDYWNWQIPTTCVVHFSDGTTQPLSTVK